MGWTTFRRLQQVFLCTTAALRISAFFSYEHKEKKNSSEKMQDKSYSQDPLKDAHIIVKKRDVYLFLKEKKNDRLSQ